MDGLDVEHAQAETQPTSPEDPRQAELDRLKRFIEQQRAQIRDLTNQLGERKMAEHRLRELLTPFAHAYHAEMARTPDAVVVVRPAGPHGVEKSVPVRAFHSASLALFGKSLFPGMTTSLDHEILTELKDGAVGSNPTTPLMIWCDGSGQSDGQTAGEAAGGIVIVDGPKRVERGVYLGKGTNNHAELSAVKFALLIARDELSASGRPIVIHTDSEYTIGMLSRGWTAKANQELIAETIALIQQFKDVKFKHVKGHAGDVHNEMADRLAAGAVAAQAQIDSMARVAELLRPPKKQSKLGTKTKPIPPPPEVDVPDHYRLASYFRDFAQKIPSVHRVLWGQRLTGEFVFTFLSYTVDATTNVAIEKLAHRASLHWPREGTFRWDWEHALEVNPRDPWVEIWTR